MSPLKFALIAIFISWAGFGICNGASNVLYANEVLKEGQSLVSNSGRYILALQKDCDLVLTDYAIRVWSTRTAGRGPGCYLKMQSDGNLVLYSSNNNRAVWATNAVGRTGNYVCILQNDRNIAVYGPGMWSSGTHTVGIPEVDVTSSSAETTATTESETPTIANDVQGAAW